MKFELTLPAPELEHYVTALLRQYIPDGYSPPPLGRHLDNALGRTEQCFSAIHRKYFREGDRLQFNHLNGDQFAAFLYYLANTVWRESGHEGLPTRLFSLNKILHGLDLYFAVAMPEVFRLVHPVGTVLGRAEYGNHLMVYQNCAVGANEHNVYPKFSDGTILYARTSILGSCKVGDNVVFGANTFLLNSTVPSNSVVVGQYPTHRVLPNDQTVLARAFDPPTEPG